jgi:hypothetical protein
MYIMGGDRPTVNLARHDCTSFLALGSIWESLPCFMYQELPLVQIEVHPI